MLLTLDGRPVTGAKVTFPAKGAWHARVSLVEGAAPAGRVVLEADGLALSGTVLAGRSGVFRGAPSALIVGGAGGLSRQVPAKGYRAPLARQIAEDVLGTVGEVLSASSSDPNTLAVTFPHWVRLRAEMASIALELLCTQLGAAWRVVDDGSIALGPDTWSTSSWAGETISSDESSARATLAGEDMSLRPGTILEGRRVRLVEYSFSSRAVRAEVEYE